MLSNYFKMARRQLVKNKSYTAINMIGLAVGIASSLVIFLVLNYELSYENFQSKKDNIHRVVSIFSNTSNGEITGYSASAPFGMADALRTDFPQLKVAAVWNIGGAQIHVPVPGKDEAEEKRFKENTGLFFVEPSLFEIFDYNFIEGDAKRLEEPNTAVITESLADKYFGGWKNAMGQTIQMWSFRVPLRVVGVYKDLPANTDMQVKMAASYITLRGLNSYGFKHLDWEFLPWSSECFMLSPGQAQTAQIEKQLPQFVNKYYPVSVTKSSKRVSLSMQALGDMHLNENFSTFKGDALSHKELWSLGLIGVFLLIVACINFINLATSQSVNRAKEVGVRKVLGGTRSSLLKQFLNETALICFLSLLTGYLLVQLALPLISNLVGKPLSLNLIQNPSIFLFLILLGTIVTFLAGFYPGIVLSGFNPVDAIKSKISTSKVGGLSLRRGLVILQFVIAQFLIIGTIVVIRQMDFFRNRSLGFEKNTTAILELPSDSLDQLNYHFLKAELLKVPGVQAASFCLDAPATFATNNTSFYFENNPIKKDFSVDLQFADTSYYSTFNIKLVAGRIPYERDTLQEFVVNEALVAKLGFRSPQDILGKTISFDEKIKNTIVGVVHDFNSKSLKQAVKPMALTTNSHAYNYIAMRMDPSKLKASLGNIQRAFTHIYPTYIYDLTFLDERISHFYETEAMASNLFQVAAFLAIFISCIGLYGLISFMAVQKTKEVGIRKVLGASARSIVYLFSKEFTLLIGIAFIISAPIGYLLMQKWLGSFYYHIKIGWGVFALAIVLSVFIAWVTIGYKALKAAWANPVKSLKSE